MSIVNKQQLAFKLAKTSLVLWLISLCLIGFGDMRGGAILYLGTLMGWTVPQGWAVYANYFYLYILIQILRGKKPIASVFFMAGLSLILPISIIRRGLGLGLGSDSRIFLPVFSGLIRLVDTS